MYLIKVCIPHSEQFHAFYISVPSRRLLNRRMHQGHSSLGRYGKIQPSRDGHGTEVITVAVIIIVATSYKAPITHRHSSLSLSHALPHLVFTSTLRGRGY